MNEEQKGALIKKAREDLEFRDLLLSEPETAAQQLNITLTKEEVQSIHKYREKMRSEADSNAAPSVTGDFLGGFLDS